MTGNVVARLPRRSVGNLCLCCLGGFFWFGLICWSLFSCCCCCFSLLVLLYLLIYILILKKPFNLNNKCFNHFKKYFFLYVSLIMFAVSHGLFCAWQTVLYIALFALAFIPLILRLSSSHSFKHFLNIILDLYSVCFFVLSLSVSLAEVLIQK